MAPSSSGPIPATSLATQTYRGRGSNPHTPGTNYTGVPGMSDVVMNPFTVGQDLNAQQMAGERRQRYDGQVRDRNYEPNWE